MLLNSTAFQSFAGIENVPDSVKAETAVLQAQAKPFSSPFAGAAGGGGSEDKNAAASAAEGKVVKRTRDEALGGRPAGGAAMAMNPLVPGMPLGYKPEQGAIKVKAKAGKGGKKK